MNETEIKNAQNQYVVKSNDLIRRTRYNLTVQQQKILLFAISKIKPTDTATKQYEIDINELCEVCGLDLDSSGYYYKSIKNDIRDLTRRIWVEMPDKTESTISFIGDATIIPLSGKVYIKFHEKIVPFLFELKERYTQYQLKNILAYKSKYSIRLYEILRSYTTQAAIDAGIEKEVRLSLDELRRILAVEQYKRWADFNRYVIKKAIEEINKYSEEMKITYDTYRDNGRTITHIIFIISKPSAKEQLNARKLMREKLAPKRKMPKDVEEYMIDFLKAADNKLTDEEKANFAKFIELMKGDDDGP